MQLADELVVLHELGQLAVVTRVRVANVAGNQLCDVLGFGRVETVHTGLDSLCNQAHHVADAVGNFNVVEIELGDQLAAAASHDLHTADEGLEQARHGLRRVGKTELNRLGRRLQRHVEHLVAGVRYFEHSAGQHVLAPQRDGRGARMLAGNLGVRGLVATAHQSLSEHAAAVTHYGMKTGSTAPRGSSA